MAHVSSTYNQLHCYTKDEVDKLIRAAVEETWKH